MMPKDEIQREITLTLDMMRSAPLRDAGYLVVKLAARRAWQQMQGISEVTP